MRIAIDSVFKNNDRVYHYIYGWGTVIDMGKSVVFDEKLNMVMDVYPQRHLLSFTRYIIEGFSQERPKELPKVGQIVWVKGIHTRGWEIGHFMGKTYENYYVNTSPSLEGNRIRGTQIRATNPYEEQNTN